MVLRRLFHVEKKINKPVQIQALDGMRIHGYEIFNRNQQLMRHGVIHVRLTFCRIPKRDV